MYTKNIKKQIILPKQIIILQKYLKIKIIQIDIMMIKFCKNKRIFKYNKIL